MAIAFAAGEVITAAKLNKLQPATYRAIGSGTVAAGSTNAAVTGCSVTFTTLGASAVYLAFAVFHFKLTGASTATALGKCYVDGVAQAELASYAAEVATDTSAIPQNFRGILTAAGSHTIDLRATTAAGQTVTGINTTLTIMVFEQN